MPNNHDLYVGLMSGTSLDAIDAALLRFTDIPPAVEILATHELPFPAELRDKLQTFIESSDSVNLDDLGQLHRSLGLSYAAAVKQLLEKAHIDAGQITAIGNHGQTIRHRPDATPAFTLQIGDGATIANECGIATVADFRSADIALGGQGAPLAPVFHSWAFGNSPKATAVVNIGGIANASIMRPGSDVLGFDTGPGNTLLDAWYSRHHGTGFDHDGAWASKGTVVEPLLEAMLQDAFFSQPSPKSTGREYFHASWLDNHLERFNASTDSVDIQATLSELTARSIATDIASHLQSGPVYLCGGGAYNSDLVTRIRSHLPNHNVESTDILGIPPEWVEAAAFAWLARMRMHGRPVATPSITGARSAAVLGSVYLPPEA